VSGTLTSFNYPTVPLELIRYTTCVRREAGYCGIQWAQSQPTTNLGNAASTVTPDPFNLAATLSTGNALTVSTCDSAYITIPGSGNTVYCGTALIDQYAATAASQDYTSSSVYSVGVPFMITYSASGGISNNAGDPDDIGYSLQYIQIPCSSSVSHVMGTTA